VLDIRLKLLKCMSRKFLTPRKKYQQEFNKKHRYGYYFTVFSGVNFGVSLVVCILQFHRKSEVIYNFIITFLYHIAP